MKFGLACEGITDQITIENILCGYFNEVKDLDEEITYLQPPVDETDKKQQGFGGWNVLLSYLSSTHFRDDVLNTEYSVIQIDTDVSQEIGFEVDYQDDDHQELSVGRFIERVKNRLIEQIQQGDEDFYRQYESKIIFCVTVHSIECWLLALHVPSKPNRPKIKQCETALKRLLGKGNIPVAKALVKNKKGYDCLSRPFLKRKILNEIACIEPSLAVFVNNLGVIFHE